MFHGMIPFASLKNLNTCGRMLIFSKVEVKWRTAKEKHTSTDVFYIS